MGLQQGRLKFCKYFSKKDNELRMKEILEGTIDDIVKFYGNLE